ncbi:MFS transporter [Actinophytocola algeriensis]|uniref:MFS family permease n=1 Tax=Actinophytocola algeriensis TaxID=1768010 RepID=A0A7W7Q6G1_9PSEU|nr:MFS transporter [Actinophytocola algeriensis]MBB4907952.1 MFS family permease [Actinophytocola algeriensis]MBE1479982.1 MFS family permease [Actinophytocola algeriensis]
MTTLIAPPRLSAAGLATLLLSTVLAPIDLFIVNVALPTIQSDLHASTSALEWVLAGYGVAFALLLVIGGRLGDALGRRRVLTWGLAAFTVTSLICGLAPTTTVLVLARAAQGAAAALMVPQVFSIMQATTSGEQRARTLGYFAAAAGVAMVLGQVLGGVLVAADVAGAGWRPIFLVNVPIGIAVILLVSRTLPESRAVDPIGVDRWGTVLLGGALLALLVPLLEGRTLGWPAWCWALLVLSPVLAASYFAVARRLERTGGVPLLPPTLLRMQTMRHGVLIAVPVFAGFGGFMFVFALVFQTGLHYSPLTAGLALTPAAIGFLVMSLQTSCLVARHGRRVLVTGAIVQVTGLLALTATTLNAWPDISVLDLAPGALLYGMGQGAIAPVLFRVILSGVPTEAAGAGSGVLTTTQQTSLALGVATLGSLFVALAGTLGMRDALVLTTLLMAGLSAVVGVLTARLPDPRHTPR